ncbi:MAG: glycosyltransferase [Candidatus Aenigmarchaeota archaeon]|nr:glycosyltransferase [Candidatus Aenigmarchaeota archaeon]
MRGFYLGGYIISDHTFATEANVNYDLLKELSNLGISGNVVAGNVEINEPIENFEFSGILSPMKKRNNIYQVGYCTTLKYLYKSYRHVKRAGLRDFDFIHRMNPFKISRSFDIFALEKSILKHKIPLICGPIYPLWYDELNNLKTNPILKKFFSITMKMSSAIIIYTPIVKTLIKKFVPDIDDSKIHVVTPGINIGNLEINKKHGDSNIIFIGKLYKRRNLDIAIKAFEKYKRNGNDCKFIIIGDGPERSNLESLATKLNLKESIEFKGFIPRDELYRYYENAALSVDLGMGQPNRVFFESLLSSTPVLVPQSRYTRGLLIDKQNCLTIKSLDVDSVAKKIEFSLKNPKLLSKITKRGKSDIKENWNIKKSAKQIKEIYESVI